MHTSVKSLLALALMSGGALASASDVRVGVSVAGEVSPGVYGRVEVGNMPPPVVYATPVIAVQPVHVAPAPVYLHVPPGHAKKWHKHCHKYHACSQPVYFVRSAEYGRHDGKHDRGHHGHKGKHRD
jgi:hypothetical protein